MPNATQQDYYEVLGVPEEASQDDVRKAYRELARKYHPDKTGGDKEAEDKLKEINAAYDVLKNPEKRKEYDRQRAFGADGLGGFDFSGGGPDLSDLFGSMFGAQPQRGRAYQGAPGADLTARIHVTLKEVATGVSKTLRIRRADVCGACKGSGAAPGTSPVTCPECQGEGQVTNSSGFFQMSQTCPRCHGAGQAVTTPCSACRGVGRKSARREIVVTVPPGIESGARLRVANEGEPGYHGGPHGSLYVRVDVEPDPFFERQGPDLVCETPITFAEATLGAKVTVPTLDGVAKVSVQPGTQHAAQLRMRGMGLPIQGRSGRGDQLVRIIVETPRRLTREQVKLMKEFDGNYEPGSHPLQDKFRDLLKRLRGA